MSNWQQQKQKCTFKNLQQNSNNSIGYENYK